MNGESTLPQGNKSRVTPTADGAGIRKVYNHNGDPHGKYAREVGFYVHYGASPLIPDLLECLPDKPAIVITRAPGVPCSTMAPASDLRRRLSVDYADKVADLFCSSADASAVKESLFAGRGAAHFRNGVLSVLDGYATDSRPSERILARLRTAARGVTITDELLIKLDWNASNTFVNGGAISQFIDFEQAFIGTREMLAGILLHNPFWCARSVFSVLRRRGLFPHPVAAVAPWVGFAFGAVLADSFERSGRRWSADRLESAYRRHVVDRIAELASRA